MSTISNVTEEFESQLNAALDQLGYKGNERDMAIKAVEKYLTARGVKLMSGRSYATKYFKQWSAYEQKLRDKDIYVDAMEIVDMAEYM